MLRGGGGEGVAVSFGGVGGDEVATNSTEVVVAVVVDAVIWYAVVFLVLVG